MNDVQARLDAALRIARAAGDITLEYFQRDNFDVERKVDDSPVTQADRSAEQRMREEISTAFPNDGIVGEEFGEQSGTSAYRWILDPIDGTKSFICGVPLYSVLIGVLRDDESVAGVIHIPALRETISAGQNEGAWWNRADQGPVKARVSSRRLSSGLFVTSQADGFEKRGAAGAFGELERAAYITRTWGDGYGYLLVATGRAEASRGGGKASPLSA